MAADRGPYRCRGGRFGALESRDEAVVACSATPPIAAALSPERSVAERSLVVAARTGQSGRVALVESAVAYDGLPIGSGGAHGLGRIAVRPALGAWIDFLDMCTDYGP